MLSAWSRFPEVRKALPSGTLPLLGIVLLLVLCVSNSTVAANWVPGSNVLTPLALLAALVMGALAVTSRIPSSAALAIGGLLTPVTAFAASHDILSRAHPNDPGDPLGVIGTWAGRIASGETANDIA